jgi:hypothetical protein
MIPNSHKKCYKCLSLDKILNKTSANIPRKFGNYLEIVGASWPIRKDYTSL